MEEEGLGRFVLSLCVSWVFSGFHWVLSISGPKVPLPLSPSELILSKYIYICALRFRLCSCMCGMQALATNVGTVMRILINIYIFRKCIYNYKKSKL